MVFVSVTRLRVRDPQFMESFVASAMQAGGAAKVMEGCLSAALLMDGPSTFWTLTLWTDEAAMRDYALAGAHREIMPNLVDWCDEAALAHWTQDGTEPPAWSAAHRMLTEVGRRSRVRHPSPDHEAFRVPEPAVAPGREMALK